MEGSDWNTPPPGQNDWVPPERVEVKTEDNDNNHNNDANNDDGMQQGNNPGPDREGAADLERPYPEQHRPHDYRRRDDHDRGRDYPQRGDHHRRDDYRHRPSFTERRNHDFGAHGDRHHRRERDNQHHRGGQGGYGGGQGGYGAYGASRRTDGQHRSGSRRRRRSRPRRRQEREKAEGGGGGEEAEDAEEPAPKRQLLGLWDSMDPVPRKDEIDALLVKGKMREQKLRDIEKFRKLHPDKPPEVIESMVENQKKLPFMNMLHGAQVMPAAIMPPPAAGPLAIGDAPVNPGGATGDSLTNSLGYPLRPGTMACTYFAKMGSCKYGAQCKWDHPEHFCNVASQKRALMAARVGMILPGPGAPNPMLALPSPGGKPSAGLGLGLGLGLGRPPMPGLMPSLASMGVRPNAAILQHQPSAPPPDVPNTPIGQRLPVQGAGGIPLMGNHSTGNNNYSNFNHSSTNYNTNDGGEKKMTSTTSNLLLL